MPVSPFVFSMAGIQKHVFLESLVILTFCFFFFLIKWQRYLTCEDKLIESVVGIQWGRCYGHGDLRGRKRTRTSPICMKLLT